MLKNITVPILTYMRQKVHGFVGTHEQDPNISKCLTDCPFEFETKEFYSNHLSGKNDESNTTIIKISYENQMVNLLWQAPKTEICDLVSKVGGLLGLLKL